MEPLFQTGLQKMSWPILTGNESWTILKSIMKKLFQWHLKLIPTNVPMNNKYIQMQIYLPWGSTDFMISLIWVSE